jgi:hypothetical protein
VQVIIGKRKEREGGRIFIPEKEEYFFCTLFLQFF